MCQLLVDVPFFLFFRLGWGGGGMAMCRLDKARCKLTGMKNSDQVFLILPRLADNSESVKAIKAELRGL